MTGVTSDTVMHRVPASTPTISASDSSSRVRWPDDGSPAIDRGPGHVER
ncbi:MAG: hypothetical protein ABFE13_25145 [Phycisphaerales bacterium]